MAATIDLPTEYIDRYKRLFHITTYDASKSILNSSVMYGNDTRGHANFATTYNQAYKLSKYKHIALEFLWEGEQKVFFGDLSSGPKPDFESGGPRPNVLYHIFYACQYDKYENGENLGNLKYWQSILFNDSEALILSGVEDVYYRNSEKQSLIMRLISKDSRAEHRDWRFAKNNTEELISSHMGTSIDVINSPELIKY